MVRPLARFPDRFSLRSGGAPTEGGQRRPGAGRGSAKQRGAGRRSLGLELLESRQLLAVTASLVGARVEAPRDAATGSVLPPDVMLGGAIMGAAPDGAFNGELYSLGIIDILQLYTLRKRGETVVKSLVHPVADISSVSPRFYADRFVDYISAHTE